MPLGRCGVETVQGVGSLPILRAMVRVWPRQRRNAQSPIRSRADHTTHATAYKLSAVAAEFSGCVGGRRRNRFRTVRFHCSTFPNRTRCAGLRSGLGMTTEASPPCRIRTDRVQKPKRDGFPMTDCLIPRRASVPGAPEFPMARAWGGFLRRSVGNGLTCQWADCARWDDL